MEVEEIVRNHYGGADLYQLLRRRLTEAGVDLATLSANDLAPVDQLHAGGAAATGYLLSQLELGPATRLLDLGCGIGGPARLAAGTYSCPVVGFDLSADFIDIARRLSADVGLASLVEYRVAAGNTLDVDVEAESFDRAMMIHVGMNIPDKTTVFAEVRRVLRPGAWFGLFEQMRTATAELPYPLPWAEDERSSFVASVEEYVAALTEAGFVVDRVENRAAATAAPGDGQPGLSPAAVFGPRFVERIGNNIAATRAGLLAPMVVLARAR